jgi:hypothetical protein
MNKPLRLWPGVAGAVSCFPSKICCSVASEEGDLVLVAASPDQHTEIAKFKAIEGKT